MKILYTPHKNNYFFSEGINTLCDMNSRDEVLNKTFTKIVAEHLKESGESYDSKS
jgi:hypothetical protein